MKNTVSLLVLAIAGDSDPIFAMLMRVLRNHGWID